jgi:hemoglobin
MRIEIKLRNLGLGSRTLGVSKFRRYLVAVLISGLLIWASCTENQKPSLYTRIGGIQVISSVVVDFLEIVKNNNAINSRFTAVFQNQYRELSLRNHFIDQICELTGGPCIYKGLPMQTAHSGMHVTPDEFDLLMADLSTAMTQNSIADPDAAEVISLLKVLEPDVVHQ